MAAAAASRSAAGRVADVVIIRSPFVWDRSDGDGTQGLLGQCSHDLAEDAVHIADRPVRVDSQHPVAGAFKLRLPLNVTVNLILVNSAIDLDDKPGSRAEEVDDVRPDGLLATESIP